ncbi:MAG: 3-deoxy-manno-octulosonate cytidylyltransferase [Candidatus Eisenbacteria sp.]|nr:3-deoxy-manno-octulosonate cytidylyltransferase [Candidatus Eisenbacteria bacterium]
MGCPRSGLAIVIPARLDSSRIPRKLLLSAAGRTILEWTYRRAVAACRAEAVWVATDSDEIAATVTGFGGQVLRTGAHPSGTHRVAAAVAQLAEPPDGVINLQGDEPLIDPGTIVKVAERLRGGAPSIVTCGAPLRSLAEWRDPSVVKVVCRADGTALYFSRQPIPGSRAGTGEEGFALARGRVYQHVGIYGFPTPLLARFARLEATPLAEIEGLEQLRALEAGLSIEVVPIEAAVPAVDTPGDLERVRRQLAHEVKESANHRGRRPPRPAPGEQEA